MPKDSSNAFLPSVQYDWYWLFATGLSQLLNTPSLSHGSLNVHFPIVIDREIQLGLGNMAKNNYHDNCFILVNIDNYHDKCQIFISFKFKGRLLLLSESCRNQSVNCGFKITLLFIVRKYNDKHLLKQVNISQIWGRTFKHLSFVLNKINIFIGKIIT